MFSKNPFPESYEKKHLRRVHLLYLAKYKQSLNRDLTYFGLPSTEMLDVEIWKSLLGNITAVERDPNIALLMHRTAKLIDVRSRTIIIEGDLSEICQLLALDGSVCELSLAQLAMPDREKILRAKSIGYDVINIDYCGGFIYPRQGGESENSKVLQNIITFQARHKTPFLLLLTFNLRDTGWEHYDIFINESFDGLQSMGIEANEIKNYYLDEAIEGQPRNLRRLRFCVPVYLHKTAFSKFQVKVVGAWHYKNFYHAALFFEPRLGISSLGATWPPLDEFKDIINTKLIHLDADDQGNLSQVELLAPYFEKER
jgi:hypothetical protein